MVVIQCNYALQWLYATCELRKPAATRLDGLASRVDAGDVEDGRCHQLLRRVPDARSIPPPHHHLLDSMGHIVLLSHCAVHTVHTLNF